VLTEKDLFNEFKKILKLLEVNKTASVVKDSKPRSVLSVTWNESQALLHYSSKLFEITRDLLQIKSLIEHEVCHIITAPSTQVVVLETSDIGLFSASTEFVDIFREYIAEKEFVRRRRIAPLYLEAKKKMLSPDTVINQYRKGFTALGTEKFFAFLVMVSRIFYDSIYFHLVDNDTFVQWCAAAKAEGFLKLFYFVLFCDRGL